MAFGCRSNRSAEAWRSNSRPLSRVELADLRALLREAATLIEYHTKVAALHPESRQPLPDNRHPGRRYRRQGHQQRRARSLRALWATTVVICLLAVGARPATRDDVRERNASYLDTAHGAMASHVVRRIGVPDRPDGRLRSLYIVPIDTLDDVAPRTPLVVDSQQPPTRVFSRFVRTGSSRGPPRG